MENVKPKYLNRVWKYRQLAGVHHNVFFVIFMNQKNLSIILSKRLFFTKIKKNLELCWNCYFLHNEIHYKKNRILSFMLHVSNTIRNNIHGQKYSLQFNIEDIFFYSEMCKWRKPAIHQGVRQEHSLSPVLFGGYIEMAVDEMKEKLRQWGGIKIQWKKTDLFQFCCWYCHSDRE